MKRLISRAKPLGISLAIGGAAAIVFAGHDASADAPSYKSIPTAKLPPSPDTTKAPETIPAGEKVDGIFVAKPPEDQRKRNEANGYKMAYVFGTDKEAKEFAATGSMSTPKPEELALPRACIATNNSFASSSRASLYIYIPRPVTPPKTQKKPSGLGTLGGLSSTPQPPTRPRHVFLVRTERLLQGEGGPPKLEIADAWVDADTTGARLVNKASVPLGRVGTSTGPGNLEIYAARDEKNVQFVVRSQQRPGDKDLPAHLIAMGSRMNAQTPNGSASTSECGHLRMSLAVEPGGGQMATIFGTAMLPPAPDDDEGPVDSSKTADDDDDEQQRSRNKFGTRDLRTRPYVASLSVSQTKSEKEPIVSVAFGWAGKDQHSRF